MHVGDGIVKNTKGLRVTYNNTSKSTDVGGQDLNSILSEIFRFSKKGIEKGIM